MDRTRLLISEDHLRKPLGSRSESQVTEESLNFSNVVMLAENAVSLNGGYGAASSRYDSLRTGPWCAVRNVSALDLTLMQKSSEDGDLNASGSQMGLVLVN